MWAYFSTAMKFNITNEVSKRKKRCITFTRFDGFIIIFTDIFIRNSHVHFRFGGVWIIIFSQTETHKTENRYDFAKNYGCLKTKKKIKQYFVVFKYSRILSCRNTKWGTQQKVKTKTKTYLVCRPKNESDLLLHTEAVIYLFL